MRLLVNLLFTLCQKSRLCHLTNQRLPALFSRNVTGFMATNSINEPLTTTFNGRLHHFNGITVNSKRETCDITLFEEKVDSSIQKWREEARRGIWFKIYLEHSDWIPVLAKKGFRYHHAKDDYVLMYLWLPMTENCNIPPYAHTMLGVGAVVINDKNEILVVCEKYFKVSDWKLPGGYVEPGENLVDAAIREVYEETGITTEFQSVLTLRQGHGGMFGCSDIYTVISLKPLTLEIKKCDREIENCIWLDVNEYLNHPNIHELNKFFVQKYLEYGKKNLKIDWYHGIHQILKKPYTVYYVTDKDEITNNKL